MNTENPSSIDETESTESAFSNEIRISQILDEEDLKEAAWSHLRTFKWRFWRPIIGTIFIVESFILYAFLRQTPFAIVAFMLGLYFVSLNRQYVYNFVKQMREGKLCGEEIEIRFRENEIFTRSFRGEGRIRPETLHGYRVSRPGILLYFQRNMFTPIKEEGFESSEDMNNLIETLENLGVKRL